MTPDEFLDEAICVARHSPNRVRKVGAVLQAARGAPTITACNTYPAGVRDLEERHAGDGRLVWMEHAERNALFAAARSGVPTEGARLASTYFPCIDCARAIVQCGVSDVYTLPPDLSDPVWGEGFLRSRVILEEGGVRLHFSVRDPAAVRDATMLAPGA